MYHLVPFVGLEVCAHEPLIPLTRTTPDSELTEQFQPHELPVATRALLVDIPHPARREYSPHLEELLWGASD
jgi:hypothetical protein